MVSVDASLKFCTSFLLTRFCPIHHMPISATAQPLSFYMTILWLLHPHHSHTFTGLPGLHLFCSLSPPLTGSFLRHFSASPHECLGPDANHTWLPTLINNWVLILALLIFILCALHILCNSFPSITYLVYLIMPHTKSVAESPHLQRSPRQPLCL